MQGALNIRRAVRNAHHSHPCWYWLCRWRTDYTMRILSFSLCSCIQQWRVSSKNQFCFCSWTFKSFMTPESEDALNCYTSAKAGHSISGRINWDRTKVKKVSRRGSKKLAVYSQPDVLVSLSVWLSPGSALSLFGVCKYEWILWHAVSWWFHVTNYEERRGGWSYTAILDFSRYPDISYPGKTWHTA